MWLRSTLRGLLQRAASAIAARCARWATLVSLVVELHAPLGATCFRSFHTPSHVLGCDAVRLAEGVIEAGCMLESAAESYLVDAHALVCLKQMTGAFHLYLQHERAGRAARDGHYLAVELA